MAEKKLTVYREGYGLYRATQWDDISAFHRRMKFDNGTFLVDDVLYSSMDRATGNTENMLVVEEVRDDAIIVRTADRGPIKDLRPFADNEEFTLIARYE